ncbi:MAG: VanZ family protein [Thiobacillus sp.]|nr:VanZ family protein [Thiobacillus sp.]
MNCRTCWLALGWLLVAAVCWLSLTPRPVESGIDQGDKVGHVLAYLSLMAWWGQLHPRTNRLLLLFVLMGAGLEVIQGLTPERQPSFLDLLANTAGALLGWVATRTWPGWLRGLERRLAP